MHVSIGEKAYLIEREGDTVRVRTGIVVCRTERLNEETSVSIRTDSGSVYAALEDEVWVKGTYDYAPGNTIGAKVLALLEPKQPPADEPVIGDDGKVAF